MQADNTGVSHILITSGFNIPHIDWTTLNVTSISVYNKTFLNLLDNLFYYNT